MVVALAASARPAEAATRGNPLATADQLASERAAIALVGAPEITQAKDDLKSRWLAAAKARGDLSPEFLGSPQSLADLQLAADEIAFFAAISATNEDASRPKVIMNESGPHRWRGLDVPGSRLLNDNPDTIYRSFPVDHDASYVLTGRFGDQRPADFTISVLDGHAVTVGYLDGKDIVVGPDGAFAIALVPGPGAPGKNRLVLAPGAVTVFVRDTINRWGVQKVTSLEVKRLDRPVGLPRTRAEMVAAAVGKMSAMGGFFGGLTGQFAHQPVNTVSPINSAKTLGRLVTQAASQGAFDLQDDEALVVTVNLGGAAYFVLPVCTHWMTTTDFVGRTQSLNNAQAEPNPDGTYTFVLSPTDPKVFNWVDTVGLRQGTVAMRWQALPQGANPAVAAKVVKMSDLAAALPKTMRLITAREREAQRRERRASFAARFAP